MKMIAELNDAFSQREGNRKAKVDLRIIKVRDPGMSLATRTPDVVEMPCYGATMQRNIKHVLCDAHGLYSSVEDIV